MNKLRTFDPILLSFLINVVVSVLLIASSVTLMQYKQDLKKEKAQSTVYQNEANYERLGNKRLQGRNLELERDLAEVKRLLADSAEREDIWQKRASRSRSAGMAEEQRSGAYSGGLRDITMYCPTGNRTASGKWPQRGMVATISRNIPFGTRLSIQGLGTFTVEDRIGRGSEFDLFTPSCSEAIKFGRQHRRVTILKE